MGTLLVTNAIIIVCGILLTQRIERLEQVVRELRTKIKG